MLAGKGVPAGRSLLRRVVANHTVAGASEARGDVQWAGLKAEAFPDAPPGAREPKKNTDMHLASWGAYGQVARSEGVCAKATFRTFCERHNFGPDGFAHACYACLHGLATSAAVVCG